MSVASAPVLDFDARIRRIAALLYGVAIGSTWLYANLPLHLATVHRLALNLITVPAFVSLVAVWFFPWQRFHRLLFLAMTGSALLLITLAVAASGGWSSPLVLFYFLVVIFNTAYYPRRLAAALDCLVVLCSTSPALYQPAVIPLIAHLLLFGPACLCIGLAADLMMHEVRQRGREVGALVARQEQRARELARLAALHRAGMAVSAELDAQRVMETVVNELAASLGYHFVGVYLREGDAQHLRAQVGFAVPLERIGLDEGVIGRVYRTGRGVLVEDVHADTDYLITASAVRSEVCVPILGDGVVIGVVNVESDDRLDRDDLEVLALFAQQIGAALANARLYRAARESAAGLAAAQRIAHLGSWEVEIATGVVSWSDEQYGLFGLIPGEVTATLARFLAAIHPDDRARYVAASEANLASGVRAYSPVEFRILRPDGTVRMLVSQGEVVRDAAGRSVRVVGTDMDITERKRAEEDLHRNAYHDLLTGLPNRHAFAEHLSAAPRPDDAADAGRFAVLFLDLDRFKNVNDSLGHHRGDELLAQVAARLRECLGLEVIVSRFGGDEFAILLEGIADSDDAVAAAERVHACLHAPVRLRGLEMRITASIGIAIGDRRRDADQLLRDADIAMYRAKARGRGRTALFDAGMRAAVTQQLMLETDLQRAVEREEFRLVYQPIVALATGQVVGFESLARWEHPRMGLLTPDEFIPTAEETGVIVPLGEWVLRAACAQLAAWRARDPAAGSLTMGVNLSGQQISEPGFVGQVERILAETDIPPHRCTWRSPSGY